MPVANVLSSCEFLLLLLATLLNVADFSIAAAVISDGFHAVAFVPAIACVLAVAGIPAVAGVLAVTRIRVDPVVPILASVFAYCT